MRLTDSVSLFFRVVSSLGRKESPYSGIAPGLLNFRGPAWRFGLLYVFLVTSAEKILHRCALLMALNPLIIGLTALLPRGVACFSLTCVTLSDRTESLCSPLMAL